jgi:hypothetical protein
MKNVQQNGIYEFHFNREIIRLRNIEKLFNITGEEENDIPLIDQNNETFGYSRLKLDNIYFCFISLIFGANIAFLLLVIEIIISYFKVNVSESE